MYEKSISLNLFCFGICLKVSLRVGASPLYKRLHARTFVVKTDAFEISLKVFILYITVVT